MKVQYHGPHDAVIVRELDDLEVKRSELVDVPDELGARLLEQATNWRVPKVRPADDGKLTANERARPAVGGTGPESLI